MHSVWSTADCRFESYSESCFVLASGTLHFEDLMISWDGPWSLVQEWYFAGSHDRTMLLQVFTYILLRLSWQESASLPWSDSTFSSWFPVSGPSVLSASAAGP